MTDDAPDPRLRVGDLDVDLVSRRVARDGDVIELPDLSFRLLAALAAAAPETVDKDALVEAVWEGVVVSDETLTQRVRLLRQALGEGGAAPRYIEAVRGRGYRLICSVAPAPSAASTAARVGRGLGVLVLVLVLVLLAIAVTVGLLPRDDSEPRIDAIAVLPFTDLSPSGDHGYFADGMQEELLTRLTRVDELRVASRTSVERFRRDAPSVPEIARELGVDAVIESSVRVAGQRIRITVQLIDASTDRHLWAENYERELTVANVFAVQQDVAARIADALALSLALPSQPPTQDLAAYDDYLIGRYHTARHTPEDLRIAIERLESAVARDPGFARAWASLGSAYGFAGTAYGRQPPREVYPRARQAVSRALALDANLADAHSILGDILTWYDWDFPAAEAAYRKAMALEPENILGYSLLMSLQEHHEEAIRLLQRRIAAAPEDPWVHVNAAWCFLRAGDDARALDAALRARDHRDAVSIEAIVLRRRGRADEAVEVLERVVRERGREPLHLAQLATAHAAAGDEAAARALLEELEAAARERYLSPALLGNVYLALGDLDRGFAAYEAAVEARARSVIFLATNQLFDGLRDDPRYRSLVERVGLSVRGGRALRDSASRGGEVRPISVGVGPGRGVGP